MKTLLPALAGGAIATVLTPAIMVVALQMYNPRPVMYELQNFDTRGMVAGKMVNIHCQVSSQKPWLRTQHIIVEGGGIHEEVAFRAVGTIVFSEQGKSYDLDSVAGGMNWRQSVKEYAMPKIGRDIVSACMAPVKLT
jgi:hypothetical protein